jgi:hypothetical protein
MDPAAVDIAVENGGSAGDVLTLPVAAACMLSMLPLSELPLPCSTPSAQQAAHWHACMVT